ncbi:hypothetical protein OH77DRAFT_1431536 [Trametes cingulata]|nr:hypothetical protein OH77DRAFT_1431536 [Trametes cingulata]
MHESRPLSVNMAEGKNGESPVQLSSMVKGEIELSPARKRPGKYLALDCEMVGVGIDGTESALARVSLVNFHGAVILDVFVRPRERVVDYRTQFSGIRPADMVHAKSFEEVQKQVADLLKDRILVGHAVHNDLKALLLSHPRPQTRDTQLLYHKHKLTRGRRPALRNLVQQELGLTIQAGEHSSVTDARATMALFRLHRKELEKDFRPLIPRARSRSKSPTRATSADTSLSTTVATTSKSIIPTKRARASSIPSDAPEDSPSQALHPPSKKRKAMMSPTASEESPPGGGRRGVSSGLSTIVQRVGRKGTSLEKKGKSAPSRARSKDKWWKELGGGSGANGAKGGLKLNAR